MEQHPVPQNVTGFQFHLVGDMTLKQFGYLAGGAIVAYICYKLPLPVFFTLPLAAGSFLLGFGLAFVPLEERPMDVWILSFLKSVYSPTLYVWQKTKIDFSKPKAVPTPPSIPAHPDPKKQPPTATPTQNVQTPVVKTQNPPIPPMVKDSDIQKMSSDQKQSPPPDVKAHPPVHQEKQDQKKESPPSPKQPEEKDKAAGFQLEPAVPEGPKKPTPTSQSSSSSKTSWLDRLLGWFKGNKKEKKHDQKATLSMPIIPKPPKVVTEKTSGTGGVAETINKLIKTKEDNNNVVFGNLKTPSVTGVSKNKEPEQDGVKDAENQQEIAQNQAEIDRLMNRNSELEKKLANLEKELSTKASSDSRIIELQKQLTDILSEKHSMEDELVSLKKSASNASPVPPSKPTIPAGRVTNQPQKGPSIKIITPDSAVKAGLPQLTTFPNVVTGIIKNHENNLLPGVLVTVRDKDGVPLRALKTNKIGQFAASTPLPNATYFIEVEDPKNQLIFDRAQITLTGKIVPAIEMVAKSQKQLSREKIEKDLFGNQEI
ncbi:hypothetical protein ACFL1A_01585 [Patescibacteria group bacterium]